MLRAVFDVMDKNHPAAKAARARARSGKLEGTAMMALDAGDQSAGSILRGIELLMKGELNPAANQFGVALRNAPDAPIASFFLGRLLRRGRARQGSRAAWERARAAKLQLPGLQVILADGWLRLGQPAEALEPLREALEREPQNDDIRRNLAIAQSHLGLHEQAYPTIVPFLERNPKDADALMVALHALYQVHIEGKTIGSAERGQSARPPTYARAYAAAKGPQLPLVEKWAEFLSRVTSRGEWDRTTAASSVRSRVSGRISCFGCTPTRRSTSLPPFSTSSVGMLRTPKRFAIPGFSSMFSFATFTRPASSDES